MNCQIGGTKREAAEGRSHCMKASGAEEKIEYGLGILFSPQVCVLMKGEEICVFETSRICSITHDWMNLHPTMDTY